MSENTGVDPQGLTLPKGGGGVADMGASFNTDLNTGTGSYALSLAVPAGPNGIAPHLSLHYQSGAGNGPFGIGWSFGAISIARKTDAGIPTYAPGAEAFVMPGVDDLVDVGDGLYRPRVDTLFYRIRRSGEGWEATDTRGTVHVLGATAQARIESTTAGFTRTACWLLESTTDTDGNAIHYTYQSDGPARQLTSVQWGTYRLDFIYEDRPDKLLDCRYGFVLPTNVRCARVELHVLDVAPTLVKSWNIGYTPAPNSGLSLLTSMTLRGHAADGSTLDAPTTTLGYRRAQPPTLARLLGIWPGLEPAAFADGKVELVDWNGDGLPDVFELRAGRARVWPNLGRGRFGVPASLPSLPSPLDLDQPGVAFADMLGNGTSCLVTLGNPAAGYTPIQERGGFGLPVRFQRAPRAAPGTARFVDLDGDGVTDLLATGDAFFALYYRTRGSASAWSEVPQTIPRHQAPAVELGDPHVRLADMNGDSLHDLVRFDGAGVTWWPYLGYGTWAEPIAMANPPRLPRSFDPRRLFIVDVDGDGCADFVYVDACSVTVWYNQGGRRCADPVVVEYTPATDIANIRLVDLNGTGTIGVLWSDVPIGPVQRGHVYLDLSGGTKPYLLEHIDNGIGLSTTIAYRPSTEYAIDAAERGDPWQTFHPFPVQCVASLIVADATTGQTATTRYLYHAARYDSANKSFLGFQVVDSITDGDASIPGQRIRNTYHLGVDPADPTRKIDGDELLRFGALRRRLLRTEVYGLDGSAEQDRPYRVVSHEYDVRIDVAPGGARIGVGYETRSLEETWERETTVYGTREMLYDPPDEHGNLPSQRMRAQRIGVAVPDLDVRSVMTFAKNTAAHIAFTTRPAGSRRATRSTAERSPASRFRTSTSWAACCRCRNRSTAASRAPPTSTTRSITSPARSIPTAA